MYFSVFAILVFVCWPVEASVEDCTFKDPSTGKFFNFSSLISP